MLALLIIIFILFLLEVMYKPRIDTLFNGDIVFWYDNVENKRVYKRLYKK